MGMCWWSRRCRPTIVERTEAFGQACPPPRDGPLRSGRRIPIPTAHPTNPGHQVRGRPTKRRQPQVGDMGSRARAASSRQWRAWIAHRPAASRGDPRNRAPPSTASAAPGSLQDGTTTRLDAMALVRRSKSRKKRRRNGRSYTAFESRDAGGGLGDTDNDGPEGTNTRVPPALAARRRCGRRCATPPALKVLGTRARHSPKAPTSKGRGRRSQRWRRAHAARRAGASSIFDLTPAVGQPRAGRHASPGRGLSLRVHQRHPGSARGRRPDRLRDPGSNWWSRAAR